MRFTLEINLDGTEDHNGMGIARILHKVARDVQLTHFTEEVVATLLHGGSLRDASGNKVGKWDIRKAEGR